MIEPKCEEIISHNKKLFKIQILINALNYFYMHSWN
jgi:hypothetical protein